MPRLKDRQRQIPNGFKFAIPEVNYQSAPFASFDAIVNSVTAIVTANPALTQARGWPASRNDVADWVDQFNAQWCDRNGWHDYINGRGEGEPPKFGPPPGAALVAGGRTLADWIGEGANPVAHELAEARAAVCARCPQNQPGDLANFFTRAASEILRQQIETAKSLELATSLDSKLGVCAACSCPMRLKVHTPLPNILRHLLPESRAALDGKCWILKESA